MMSKRIAALGGVVVLIGGVAATVSTASSSEAPRAERERSGVYEVDGSHSGVVFRIKHKGVAWFYGRFNRVEGTFELNSDDPASSSIEIVVATGSVDTANAGRDRHLKSPDFFNANQFPELKFVANSVRKTGESKFEATGMLTMLGKDVEVTVPIELTGEKSSDGKDLAGMEAVFTIKRSDWGMTRYIKEGALGDEVKLMIGIEGTR